MCREQSGNDLGNDDYISTATIKNKAFQLFTSEGFFKMGGIGFEPMTSTTSRWHSPAELTARMLDYPTPKKI